MHRRSVFARAGIAIAIAIQISSVDGASPGAALMFFDARHLGHVSKKIVASLKKRFGGQSAAARFLEIS